MQIVINISEEVYEKIQKRKVNQYDIDDICQSVFEGVSLPKGHGDLIDKNELIKNGVATKDYLNTFINTIIEADRSEEDG